MRIFESVNTPVDEHIKIASSYPTSLSRPLNSLRPWGGKTLRSDPHSVEGCPAMLNERFTGVDFVLLQISRAFASQLVISPFRGYEVHS